jgi:hypothetical protein
MKWLSLCGLILLNLLILINKLLKTPPHMTCQQAHHDCRFTKPERPTCPKRNAGRAVLGIRTRSRTLLPYLAKPVFTAFGGALNKR